MNKASRCMLAGVVIYMFLIVILPCVFAKERVFSGKVIDAETKAPIEGMVVVAYWLSPKGRYLVKEVKEALTDKKGEWAIMGEESEGKSLHPTPSIIQRPDHYDMKQPEFIIFKPGYESYDSSKGKSYTFIAYPYLDKKLGLEGIILSINEKEGNYFRKIAGKDPRINYGLPFIPIKDAERKLKSLDVPFDYDPVSVKRLYNWESLYREKNSQFYAYTLFGFKRLLEKKDRMGALIDPIFDYPDDDPAWGRELLKKQKQFMRLFEEENKYLGLNHYEYYKKKLEEFGR